MAVRKRKFRYFALASYYECDKSNKKAGPQSNLHIGRKKHVARQGNRMYHHLFCLYNSQKCEVVDVILKVRNIRS